MRKNILPILLSLVILLIPTVSATVGFEIGTSGGEKILCPTHTVSINIPIKNTGDEPGSYTITLSGSAQKWAVAAPTGFTLNPGELKSVYVWITPPSKTLPGTYDLIVKINGGVAGEKEINYSIIIKSCHNVKIIAQNTSQKLCPGKLTSYNLIVENNGEYTEEYELSLEGIAKEWATLSKQTLKLNKGEEENIVLYIKSPTKEIGTYGLTITAKSKDSDAIDSKDIKIILESCYDYSIETAKDIYSFCDHTQAKIPITVKNKGIEDNSYTLILVGPNWANLEKNKIELKKGESGIVNLVIFPDYYETGENTVKIKAVSNLGEISKEKEIKLQINPCFITKVKLSKNEDTICAQSSRNYEVSITNAGNFTEPYSLSVSGPTWATLDKKFIELKPGETEKVNLKIDAPETAGEQKIKVIAKSQEPSGTSDEDTLDLEIISKEVCFSMSLKAELNNINIARGEGALIPITIKNKGKEKATYTLEVSGAGAAYAQLKPSTVTVDSGKSETVHMYVAIPEEAEQPDYNLIISARLEDGTISSSDNVKINVVEPGEGVNAEEVQHTTTDENNSVIQENTESLSVKAGRFISSTKNKITGAFAGVTNISILKTNWKYILAGIIIVIIILILWKGMKTEDEDTEKDKKEEEVKEEKPKKKNNKRKKKKEGVINKIKELLEEEDKEED